ncbi:hypothetical protein HK104_006599 [Borealophlyctis nickersoniae]|nr:hypothetical protein HK104_006599 [Borealophlyctis nickersoniae]
MSKVTKLLGPEAAGAARKMEAEQNKAWYLDHDYSKGDIVLATEGKVKGGTLEALVEKLTLHDSLDAQFTSTFLLTYRSFTTSLELFQLLIARFNIPPPEDLEPGELQVWFEKKLTPIRLRVLNIMKSWLETYCSDDAADISTLHLIRSFATTTTGTDSLTTTTQAALLRLIDTRISLDASPSLKKLHPTSHPKRAAPPPIIPKHWTGKIKLVDLDPLEIARQLTIIESARYAKIQAEECLRKAWSDKEDPSVAENVKAMISLTNQVSGWVAATILGDYEVKKRAGYVKWFVAVAEKCRTLNNFNTMMSILAGLNSSPVHRLQRTWYLVSARTKASLENLRALMASHKNFTVYREMLHSINPPCLPFLGCYLTDLTFIEDGNPDFLSIPNSSNNTPSSPTTETPSGSGSSPDASPQQQRKLINFSKRQKSADVIREIQQYQNEPYVLQPVPEIQGLLRESLSQRYDDGVLYDMSVYLEPKETDDEKIARLLQESGFM